MIEKHLEILEQARRTLEQQGGHDKHREDVMALLDVLARSLALSEPADQNGESISELASNLVSMQSMPSLLKQQAVELDALSKLSINLTSSLDMTTVLNAVVREAMGIVQNSFNAHIFLYKNKTLEFGAARQADDSATHMSMPRRNGLTYNVARGGQIVVAEDMQTHPLFASIYESVPPERRFGSIIGIPMKMDDNVVGVMNLARTVTGAFSESEIRLLNLLADQAAVAISNASLHQQVQDQAYSDTLTGLPNRRALDERMEKEFISADKTGEPFAVVMMDLDGFKDINDTYGHIIGDEVLRLFFKHIAQGIRASDFLARYGGDELCLIMGQTNLETALSVAGKITENMQGFSFDAPDGKQIHLELSGGVAIYPNHARTGSDLLRAADEALYRAKRHERGKFLSAKKLTGRLPDLNFPTASK